MGKPMNIDLQKKLIRLREKVDEIIKDAHKQKEAFIGAINWGDLHCVEALYCVDEHGTETYRVLIEEAAPDNYDFNVFVVEQLSERFNADIRSFESRTEW